MVKEFMGVYDGQFVNGKCQGFGSLIYPENSHHYAGYFDNGFKCG